METYTIWNVKGGVGKTITAVNLAAGLAIKGKRVLLIDLDGQSSSTYQLFPDREFGDEDLTIVNALPGEVMLQDCIYQTEIGNLDAVPSTLYLFTVDKSLMFNTSGIQQTKLRKMLKTIRNRYDFVIIDTNPSMNMCITNALCACDHLIIPANLEKGALKGIELSLSYCYDVLNEIDGTNFDIRILPTRIGARKAEQAALEKLTDQYKGLLMNSLIRNQESAVKDANEKNKPVIQYTSKRNKVAQDYRSFVSEIYGREG